MYVPLDLSFATLMPMKGVMRTMCMQFKGHTIIIHFARLPQIHYIIT